MKIIRTADYDRTKENRERMELGYDLLDFQDINEFHEDSTTTPFIKQVGQVLVGSFGNVQLEQEEVNAAIQELDNIISSNNEYIQPLDDARIRDIRIVQSRLKRDFGQQSII